MLLENLDVNPIELSDIDSVYVSLITEADSNEAKKKLDEYKDKVSSSLKKLFIKLQKLARSVQNKVFDKFTKLDELYKEVLKSGKLKSPETNRDFALRVPKIVKIFKTNSETYKNAFNSKDVITIKNSEIKRILDEALKDEKKDKAPMSISELGSLRTQLNELKSLYRTNIATLNRAARKSDDITKNGSIEEVSILHSNILGFNKLIGSLNRLTNKVTMILFKALRGMIKEGKNTKSQEDSKKSKKEEQKDN